MFLNHFTCMWLWEEPGEDTQIHIGRQMQTQLRRAPGLGSSWQPSRCEATLLSAAAQELCCGGEQSTNTISHICSIISPSFSCCSCRAAFAHGVLRRSAPISNLSFPGAVVHCYSYLSAGDFSTPPPPPPSPPPSATCITPGSAVLRLPSYRCAPISPLCCVVLPAFLRRSLITCSENLTG